MKHWIKAFRLRTLPLSVSTILFGTGTALITHSFQINLFLLTVATTVFLQILSNLANDYGDFVKGTDNQNRLGEIRALQSGNVTLKQMKTAIIFFSLLSFVCGILLIFNAFGFQNWKQITLFILLGITAIWAAINYTSGKTAYGYKAMGDLFVFLFFGIVGVVGTNFLFTKEIQFFTLFPAISVGLLSVAVLNLNNMRDIENDSKSNKITIPVLIGLKKSKWYHTFLIVTSFISLFIYFLLIENLFLLISLIPFIFLAVIQLKIMKNEGKELDPFLKSTALTTFILSVLFIGLIALIK